MRLTWSADPPVTPGLRDDLLDLWTDVVNAGATIGFEAPVTREDVRPRLLTYLRDLTGGRARALVGRDPSGRARAAAFLTADTHRLRRHWLWLHLVMVHPSLQGRGHGRALLSTAADAARTMGGIEAIRLSLASGHGLEDFYGGCGYREVGRVPGAFRAAGGTHRDEVTMWLPLSTEEREGP